MEQCKVHVQEVVQVVHACRHQECLVFSALEVYGCMNDVTTQAIAARCDQLELGQFFQTLKTGGTR